MYEVLENKELLFHSVASYRTKFKPQEANSIFGKIVENLKMKGIERIGQVITATHGLEEDSNKNIIADIEFLFSVNKSFESEDKLEFKQKFHLVNALKITHIGSPNDLNRSYQFLEDYINKNKLLRITSFYNVSTIEDQTKTEGQQIIETYVGINPSTL